MDVEGIRAAVTGGASGLGFATAQEIVSGGGRVVLLDLNDGPALSQCRRSAQLPMRKRDIRARRRCCDRESVDMLGGLDVAVNCAIGTPGCWARTRHAGRVLPKSDRGEPRRHAARDQGAATAMRKNAPNAGGERGVVVTASVAAFEPDRPGGHSASKSGVVGMTLPMARELASSGIRVVTIAPGIFLTPMVAGLPEEAQASLGKQVPFPSRLGRPEEFAQLVRQIITRTMLNGETIRLDGANSAALRRQAGRVTPRCAADGTRVRRPTDSAG
jgi:NAD(P)-dependent dehydrogenase (short-subunit alcohol dehydrogenase family)